MFSFVTPNIFRWRIIPLSVLEIDAVPRLKVFVFGPRVSGEGFVVVFDEGGECQ